MTTQPGALGDAVAAAVAVLGPRAEPGLELGPLTTYRVGGRAAVGMVADDVESLRCAGAALRASGLPVLVVGKGSNLLVADVGFPGLAVVLGPGLGTVSFRDTTVVAGGAAALPVVARQTVAAGLTGFEWAVGVPGTIGGAVRMNAGGHGSDMAASLRRVHVLDLRSGEDGWVDAGTLALRFRGSALGDAQVVVAAELALAPGPREVGDALLTEIVRWRREHQPGGHNGGSVFVNPVPGVLSAGEVIDRAGLKGLRVGSARISDKHANFIVVDDGGRAGDVKELIDVVQRRVAEHSGIVLHSEHRIVGFERASPEPGTSHGALR